MSRAGTSGGFLKGNGPNVGGFSAFAFHFWYKCSTVPGTASITQPYSVNDPTQTIDFGFSWDHTASTFKQSVFNHRASGTYDSAQLTSTLSANTWYAIGGAFDGTHLKAYLNGQLQASVASAPTATNIANTTYMLGKLVNGVLSNQCIHGTIAEAIFTNTAFNDSFFAALGHQRTPEEIGLAAFGSTGGADYWPLWGFHSPEINCSGNGKHQILTGTVPRGDEPPVSLGLPYPPF